MCSLESDDGDGFEIDLRRGVAPGEVTPGSWQSYVAGVLSLSGVRENIDLVVASDVPMGSGLSSSAALEVSVAMVARFGPLEATDRQSPEYKRSIAELCRKAEHDYAGVPCGIMDQMISVMGVAGHALLIDCSNGAIRQVPMPSETALVVMNTGVRHSLATGEYAKRRAACERAAAKLGVPSLRHASLAMLEIQCAGHRHVSEEERACARHVVSENGRTLAAADAIENGELSAFGVLMNESHESLRADYRVSCVELDLLVNESRAVRGVYGARMTGAGFGGCAIALARPESIDELSMRLKNKYQERFGFSCELFTTNAVSGAESLTL